MLHPFEETEGKGRELRPAWNPPFPSLLSGRVVIRRFAHPRNLCPHGAGRPDPRRSCSGSPRKSQNDISEKLVHLRQLRRNLAEQKVSQIIFVDCAVYERADVILEMFANFCGSHPNLEPAPRRRAQKMFQASLTSSWSSPASATGWLRRPPGVARFKRSICSR